MSYKGFTVQGKSHCKNPAPGYVCHTSWDPSILDSGLIFIPDLQFQEWAACQISNIQLEKHTEGSNYQQHRCQESQRNIQAL